MCPLSSYPGGGACFPVQVASLLAKVRASVLLSWGGAEGLWALPLVPRALPLSTSQPARQGAALQGAARRFRLEPSLCPVLRMGGPGSREGLGAIGLLLSLPGSLCAHCPPPRGHTGRALPRHPPFCDPVSPQSPCLRTSLPPRALAGCDLLPRPGSEFIWCFSVCFRSNSKRPPVPTCL